MATKLDSHEVFRRMRPEVRRKVQEMVEHWLWEFATATAAAYEAGGRCMPTLPRKVWDEVQPEVLRVTIEAYYEHPGEVRPPEGER